MRNTNELFDIHGCLTQAHAFVETEMNAEVKIYFNYFKMLRDKLNLTCTNDTRKLNVFEASSPSSLAKLVNLYVDTCAQK